MVLDADKSKIQAAPGFAATSWPNVNDPKIHGYWKGSAAGTAAESETHRRQGRIESDVDVDRHDAKIEGEVKTKKDKIYTDADKDKKVEVEVKKD